MQDICVYVKSNKSNAKYYEIIIQKYSGIILNKNVCFVQGIVPDTETMKKYKTVPMFRAFIT